MKIINSQITSVYGKKGYVFVIISVTTKSWGNLQELLEKTGRPSATYFLFSE